MSSLALFQVRRCLLRRVSSFFLLLFYYTRPSLAHVCGLCDKSLILRSNCLIVLILSKVIFLIYQRKFQIIDALQLDISRCRLTVKSDLFSLQSLFDANYYLACSFCQITVCSSTRTMVISNIFALLRFIYILFRRCVIIDVLNIIFNVCPVDFPSLSSLKLGRWVAAWDLLLWNFEGWMFHCFFSFVYLSFGFSFINSLFLEFCKIKFLRYTKGCIKKKELDNKWRNRIRYVHNTRMGNVDYNELNI